MTVKEEIQRYVVIKIKQESRSRIRKYENLSDNIKIIILDDAYKGFADIVEGITDITFTDFTQTSVPFRGAYFGFHDGINCFAVILDKNNIKQIKKLIENLSNRLNGIEDRNLEEQ